MLLLYFKYKEVTMSKTNDESPALKKQVWNFVFNYFDFNFNPNIGFSGGKNQEGKDAFLFYESAKKLIKKNLNVMHIAEVLKRSQDEKDFGMFFSKDLDLDLHLIEIYKEEILSEHENILLCEILIALSFQRIREKADFIEKLNQAIDKNGYIYNIEDGFVNKI